MRVDGPLSFGSTKRTWSTYLSQVQNAARICITQGVENILKAFWRSTHDYPMLSGKESILAH